MMKKPFIISGTCLAALLLLLLVTDPHDVPSFLLIVPFILLFIIFFTLFSFLLGRRGLARSKRITFSLLCTSVPILLLILQSIGQLTVRDVLTVGAVFLLSYFYISRAAATA